MAGRHKYTRLRAQMSGAAQKIAAEKSRQLALQMDLAELRRARRLSQQELANSLKTGQAAVAKIEKRTDMYVSTLRRFIRAVGGELRIIARFPDHEVDIKSFEELN